MIISQIILIVK